MTIVIMKGEIGVSGKEDIYSYFQTCCGIVYYDRTGLKGLAHAVVPSEFESSYGKINALPHDSIVTPTQAAQRLLEKMIENGANKDDLSAAIFGCQTHPIGNRNALEARKSIIGLQIPIKNQVVETNYDIALTLTSTGMLVKLLTSGRATPEKELNLVYY